MEIVGHDDLQGRSAYQPIIINQDGRQIAYVGHHDNQKPIVNPMTGKPEINGTSIVDVTDPAKTEVPRAHSTVEDRSAARRWCACAAATRCRTASRASGTCCARFGNSAHEIYDVTDPAKPSKLIDRRRQPHRHA